jgi:CheY-like chemotaxis protein
VAGRLRGLPELKGPLLVAITGYGQEEDRGRSQAAGFVAHLVKPVDLEQFKALMAAGPDR